MAVAEITIIAPREDEEIYPPKKFLIDVDYARKQMKLFLADDEEGLDTIVGGYHPGLSYIGNELKAIIRAVDSGRNNEKLVRSKEEYSMYTTEDEAKMVTARPGSLVTHHFTIELDT